MSTNWRKALIHPTASIRDAIRIIDQGSLKIALVVDDSEKLLGVVTDGDIRRGILRHVDLQASVEAVTNTSPIVCQPTDSMDTIRTLLEKRVLLHMPIVENGRITDLITWEEAHSPKHRDNPIFLMAGGFGKRLRPLTDQTPKPLLKVGDKPILESIIKRFVESGFTKFYISLHYLPEMVIEHFGDGREWGADIRYVKEDKPLGTGGALGLLPNDDLPDSPLIMMNGDVLTQVDFEQLLIFHEQHAAAATMCVRQYEIKVPFGVVTASDSMVTNIIEKPTQEFFVNAGIYVLDADLVRNVPRDTSIDMPTLLNNQIAAGKPVAMFPIHEYWLDIGQKEDFDQAQLDYIRDFM